MGNIRNIRMYSILLGKPPERQLLGRSREGRLTVRWILERQVRTVKGKWN
jgi:hypothetical protein